MAPLQISVETRDRGVIARISGQARNGEGDQLRQSLAAIAAGKPSPVIIDLRGLSFIATEGLGELIHFRELLAAYGGRLQLAGADPRITEMFRQTRLGELFPIYPDPDAALADDAFDQP